MRNPTKLGLAALLASLTLTQVVPAQNTPNSTSVPPPRPRNSAVTTSDPGTHAAASGGSMLNIEFAGGTVDQYVIAIREAASKAGGAVNIIVPADAAGVRVPAISLKSVRAQTAVRALESAFRGNSEHQFRIEDFVQDSAESPSFAIIYTRFGPPPGPVSGAASQHARARIEVFSIREIIEPITADADPATVADLVRASKDNLLHAIDAALNLQARGGDAGASPPEPPSVMYHEESGLLITRGEVAQLEVIRSVLAQLRDDNQGRRKAEMLRADREAVRARRVVAMQSRVNLQRAELETASSRLNRMLQLHAAGNASEDSIDECRLNVERARANIAQAEADLAEVQTLDPVPQSPKPAEPLSLETYIIKSAPAERIVRLASAIIRDRNEQNSGEAATADTRTNSIVVKTTPARHAIIRAAIDIIDETIENAKR